MMSIIGLHSIVFDDYTLCRPPPLICFHSTPPQGSFPPPLYMVPMSDWTNLNSLESSKLGLFTGDIDEKLFLYKVHFIVSYRHSVYAH